MKRIDSLSKLVSDLEHYQKDLLEQCKSVDVSDPENGNLVVSFNQTVYAVDLAYHVLRSAMNDTFFRAHSIEDFFYLGYEE